MNTATASFNWNCKHTWRRSAKNTGWCVLGCSIGDFGTILFFQLTAIPFPVLAIMILAIINGLITSIALETFILIKQKFSFTNALKTACGMSFSVNAGYGDCNEYYRLHSNRWRYVNVVGCAYYVDRRFLNTVAI